MSSNCKVVIIGGGLAGLSTALELCKLAPDTFQPGDIVLIDKQPRIGGNSAKASSGISAPLNLDDLEEFENDTIKSGGGENNKKLVHVLAEKGQAAIEFLTGFGIDLSTISHLGGHSRARTHRNATGPNVGFAIIGNLMKQLDNYAAITVLTNATVTKILQSAQHPEVVAGVEYVVAHDDAISEVGIKAVTLKAQNIVLASGGFSASKELLREFVPEIAEFPTTNGDWTTGDGMKIARDVGALLTDVNHVQLHPTGFVDPSHPEAPSKILAAEALRGYGGILVSDNGERFVNELSTRDVVSAAVLELRKKRSFLLLDSSAAESFGGPHIGFYQAKGLLTAVGSTKDVAEFLLQRGCDGGPEMIESNLKMTLELYYSACTGETSDMFGRTVFESKFGENGKFDGYIAEVVPVVHYCMGGVQINTTARVLGSSGPFVNLFATGEVAGGVHGRNRLAGNALLESVVFGRIAAESIVSSL